MSSPASNAKSFRHGVHPDDHKWETDHEPVERLPFPDELIMPLSQHIGAPAVPVVKAGQLVRRGQMIAKPGGFVSTALHAPATGTVMGITRRPHPNGKPMPSIVIRTDPFSDQLIETSKPPAPEQLSAQELVTHIQTAGIVGMGGATFPSHVKLAVPKGKRVEFVIINGCECEPYLTCDHVLMLERAREVLVGLQIMMDKLGAKKGYVGIENNKTDAIEVMRQEAQAFEGVEVIALKVKYPQGAEKMLIDAIFAKEVPSGKLPLDLEMVVNNVATTAAIAAYFANGTPLIERIVTVNGPAVKRPRNILAPLGTPISKLLEYCGVDYDRMRQLIMGGPMMGQAQKDVRVPVLKGTSGLLAFEKSAPNAHVEMPCIRCGRCLDACPVFLNPSRLAYLVRAEQVDELEQYHQTDCFECASCSFVCPSYIPLAQLMRLGKAMIKQKKRPN